MEIIIVECRVL